MMKKYAVAITEPSNDLVLYVFDAPSAFKAVEMALKECDIIADSEFQNDEEFKEAYDSGSLTLSELLSYVEDELEGIQIEYKEIK